MSGIDRAAQMSVVELLHRGAAGDAQSRCEVPNGGNSPGNRLKGPWNPANLIMDFWRTINRDDDLVDTSGNLRGLCVKKKAGGEECNSYVQIAEELAEGLKITVKKRFASSKDDLPDSEADHRVTMAFEVCDGQFPEIRTLPDIAHNAAAVALGVNVQNEDRQMIDSRLGSG